MVLGKLALKEQCIPSSIDFFRGHIKVSHAGDEKVPNGASNTVASAPKTSKAINNITPEQLYSNPLTTHFGNHLVMPGQAVSNSLSITEQPHRDTLRTTDNALAS